MIPHVNALPLEGLTFLDAEEVRGSNPLAPTSKDPGHKAFSFRRSRQDRRLRAEKLTKS